MRNPDFRINQTFPENQDNGLADLLFNGASAPNDTDNGGQAIDAYFIGPGYYDALGATAYDGSDHGFE